MRGRSEIRLHTGTERTAAEALTAWFAVNQRILPWRVGFFAPDEPVKMISGESVILEEPSPAAGDPLPIRDPYRTWISEIMLQQTQVSTVTEYFRRWMDRFPDVASLAAAPEKDVLEAWAGLGYYSRARNVLATARQVASAHAGRFPWRRDDLLGLKGIGEYTAGAIASLAYNRPEPILDGNLVRVFSRLYGLEFLPDTKDGKSVYWGLARKWVESHTPALVNEGLMELGALICAPRNPRCEACPLSPGCRAHSEGRQENLPPARPRKPPVDITGYAVAVYRGNQVLLYRPRKPELLAGLLTFPIFAAENPAGLRKAWLDAFPRFATPAIRPRPAIVTHGITHHRIRLRLAEIRLTVEAVSDPLPDGYVWAGVEDVDRLLVSSLPAKIWKAIR